MERAKLAENVDISADQFQRGVALRECIKRDVEQREAFVKSGGLDEKFCLPDGNWGGESANDYRTAYAHIRDGGYEILNRLKFFAQMFTGLNAMTLTLGKGLPSVQPIPPELDNIIDRPRPSSDPCGPVSLFAQWKALTDGIPKTFWHSPPLMLGEHGWRNGNIIINPDTLVYQERLSLLYDSGVLSNLKAPRILEIGGGYGALARTLMRIFPGCSYIICDLPESLMFSGLYLAMSTSFPIETDVSASGFGLLPNYRFHELSGHCFDLVLNTISMSEMSVHQVEVYAEGIQRMIGTKGIFFEQNSVGSGPETANTRLILPRYFKTNAAIESRRPATQGAAFLHSNEAISVPTPACSGLEVGR